MVIFSKRFFFLESWIAIEAGDMRVFSAVTSIRVAPCKPGYGGGFSGRVTIVVQSPHRRPASLRTGNIVSEMLVEGPPGPSVVDVQLWRHYR